MKIFVEVIAHFDVNGKITPKSIIWGDGRIFEVDKVISCCRAASLKAGGMGTRYSIKVLGKETYLFFEENIWWVISK